MMQQQFPMNVCETISSLTPKSNMDEIVEFVHYAITEDELKLSEDTYEYQYGLFDYTVHTAGYPETRGVDIWIDAEVLIEPGRHRNITHFATAGELLEYVKIAVPARELIILPLAQRCQRIAQMMFTQIQSQLRAGESFTVTPNTTQQIPLREIAEARTRAIAEMHTDDNAVAPSISRDIETYFSHNDIQCIQLLMPLVIEHVSNYEQHLLPTTGEQDHNEIGNVLVPCYEKPSVFTFSKFMEITQRSKQHRDRDFNQIMSTFEKNGWQNEILVFRGGTNHREYEIEFTGKGFFLAFTLFRDQVSRQVQVMQAAMTAWAMTNIALVKREFQRKNTLLQQEVTANRGIMQENTKLQVSVKTHKDDLVTTANALNTAQRSLTDTRSRNTLLRNNRLYHIAWGILPNNPRNYYRVKTLMSTRRGMLKWDLNTPYVKPQYIQTVRNLIQGLAVHL